MLRMNWLLNHVAHAAGVLCPVIAVGSDLPLSLPSGAKGAAVPTVRRIGPRDPTMLGHLRAARLVMTRRRFVQLS